ncbi:MAG: hypothetical protein R6U19_03035 [Bacteroidales bacterium]
MNKLLFLVVIVIFSGCASMKTIQRETNKKLDKYFLYLYVEDPSVSGERSYKIDNERKYLKIEKEKEEGLAGDYTFHKARIPLTRDDLRRIEYLMLEHDMLSGGIRFRGSDSFKFKKMKVEMTYENRFQLGMTGLPENVKKFGLYGFVTDMEELLNEIAEKRK